MSNPAMALMRCASELKHGLEPRLASFHNRGRERTEEGAGASPHRSPGHQLDGGSLAEIRFVRKATRWLRL
jgi:hypothetical protein